MNYEDMKLLKVINPNQEMNTLDRKEKVTHVET